MLLSFVFLFFLMPELLSEMRQHGGAVHEDGAALQYMTLLRMFCGFTEKKDGDTVAVFVLRETGE